MSLVAAHLPLDANELHGNNFELARLLELDDLEPAARYEGSFVGCVGDNKRRKNLGDLVASLKTLDGATSDPLVLNFGPSTPERVCIVSGAGADQLYNFEHENFDTLITGEPRQAAYHFCKENKLNAIFAGHYATETIGVQKLGAELTQRFSVSCEFIDEPTQI